MSFIEGLIHLSPAEITEIHDSILDELPGLKGSRIDLSVEALTGRIHHNLTYNSFSSIEEVAALYAEVIARGHVFNDGNKRTALLSMLTFLDLNDYRLVSDQDDLAEKFVALSNGQLTYRTFSPWLKGRVMRV